MDERRRTDGGVEQEGDEEGDERTKRTETDDVEPARTDEDSGRWKQAAVTADEHNPETTKLYINTAARDAKR